MSVLGAPCALAQETQSWSLLASLSANYSSNVVLAPVDGYGDTIGGGSFVLSYNRLRRSYDFGVTGWVFGSTFSNFQAFGGMSGGLVLNGRFSTSPVSRFRLYSSLTKGFDPRRLYGRGALLPQLDVASSTTALGWNHQPNPNTSLDLGGELNYLRYNSPVLVSTPQLVSDTFPEQATPPTPEGVESPPFFQQPDSSLFTLNQIASEGVLSDTLELTTVRIGPSLSHRFSERSRADVSAAYRWSRWDGGRPPNSFVGSTGLFELRAGFQRQITSTADLTPKYTFQRATSFPRVSTHNVAAQFDKAFSERFQLDAFLGYSHSSDELGFSAGTWTGGGGFSWRFDRGSTVVRLTRTVYQPLGFGRVLATNFAYASVSYVLTKDLFAGLYGGLSVSQDQIDTTFDYENQFAGVYASYRLSRRFSLGGGYAYRRYQFDPLPAAKTHIISASITYGRNWK